MIVIKAEPRQVTHTARDTEGQVATWTETRAEGAEDCSTLRAGPTDAPDAEELWLVDELAAPQDARRARHEDVPQRDDLPGRPRILSVGLCGWSGYRTVSDAGEVVPCDAEGTILEDEPVEPEPKPDPKPIEIERTVARG